MTEQDIRYILERQLLRLQLALQWNPDTRAPGVDYDNAPMPLQQDDSAPAEAAIVG
jgi:hypothetical protein